MLYSRKVVIYYFFRVKERGRFELDHGELGGIYVKKTMNYNEFMKTVDKKLSAMSEKEKTVWIRNIARITKEHKRIEFLDSLNEEWEFSRIIYEKDKIEKWCEEVEDGEIYFESSGYGVYGEDYWDNDYEYDQYDIFEINESLSKAYDVAKSLLFQKEYNEALLLYNRLLGL